MIQAIILGHGAVPLMQWIQAVATSTLRRLTPAITVSPRQKDSCLGKEPISDKLKKSGLLPSPLVYLSNMFTRRICSFSLLSSERYSLALAKF